jgi:CelD/BcsL family acetyltransferase involved in cellulose biosynthesis
MVRFVRNTGNQLLHDGTLQLQAMLLNNEAIAVAFGILHNGRCYYYLCDFDLKYASISPGTLVTAYAIEQAAQKGAKHFDFLRGEEDYKYKKWRAQPRCTYRVQYRSD